MGELQKLLDIMMQPPVGVQARDAFRDARFCCFPSIKLESDVQVSSFKLQLYETHAFL